MFLFNAPSTQRYLLGCESKRPTTSMHVKTSTAATKCRKMNLVISEGINLPYFPTYHVSAKLVGPNWPDGAWVKQGPHPQNRKSRSAPPRWKYKKQTPFSMSTWASHVPAIRYLYDNRPIRDSFAFQFGRSLNNFFSSAFAVLLIFYRPSWTSQSTKWGGHLFVQSGWTSIQVGWCSFYLDIEVQHKMIGILHRLYIRHE